MLFAGAAAQSSACIQYASSIYHIYKMQAWLAPESIASLRLYAAFSSAFCYTSIVSDSSAALTPTIS